MVGGRAAAEGGDMVSSVSIVRRHARRLAVVGVTIVVAALAAVVPAGAASRLSLPEPGGRYPVGAVALHLVDRARPDPWRSDGSPRELMVSVYYPAMPAIGRETPYMLPAAAAHFDAVDTNSYLGLNLPVGQVDWAATATRATLGAPAERGGRSHPVVLYSPGLGEPRTWGTMLVEDLASRGYVVVTVDNTYESPEVEFPNGFLATLTMPDDPDAFLKKALAVRVDDIRFVLDQLALVNNSVPDVGVHQGQRLPAGLAGTLDLAKVGMFGSSMGGSTAAMAMAADPRIRAGVNLDGNLTYLDGSLMPVASDGLDRPFLLLGKDGATDTGPGWQAFLANTSGWARQLTLRGSQHASFTDAEALLPQLDLSPSVLADDIGTIEPDVAVRTEEACLSAFFDRWLRGRDTGLLNGPSAAYPALEFVR
jgi:dienelactone hydrolase